MVGEAGWLADLALETLLLLAPLIGAPLVLFRVPCPSRDLQHRLGASAARHDHEPGFQCRFRIWFANPAEIQWNNEI
jgi:hypothetical protein